MSRSIRRHWDRAGVYLRQGQLLAARAQLDALRALAPEALRSRLLEARIEWYSGNPQRAARVARSATAQVPGVPEDLADSIETLLLTGASAAANMLLQRPAWQTCVVGDTLFRYVDFSQRFGHHVQALAGLDRLLAARPDDSVLHCYRGLQLEFLGRLDEAADAYTQCLALAPEYGRAAYQLSRLHRVGTAKRLLDLIRVGLGKVRSGSREQADFEFASYHVAEDLGNRKAAWRALAAANALMSAQLAVPEHWHQLGMQRLHDLMRTCPPEVAATQSTSAHPIFVLGMPRSGTTVLERMIGNHSAVTSAGELPDFGLQLLIAAGVRSIYTDVFYTNVQRLDLGEVGRSYLAETAWRAHGRAFFIDKQPANWMLLGWIHAALPGAKILHLVRDPMDVCFSNWRARFVGDTFSWSYDMGALIARYGDYRRLMDRWHVLYPGAILDVAYSDLVQHPAATLRHVFDFCGLAWEPSCEDLTRNVSAVSTLSAAAVRAPLHTATLGQWTHYGAQLAELQQQLRSRGLCGLHGDSVR